MKKTSRLVALFLSIVFVFSFTITPAFAATHTAASYDMYANKESETVSIDGITYTYRYYYEDDDRVIDIVNNESGHIDKLVYDVTDAKMYLNGSLVSFVERTTPTVARPYAVGWETLDVSSYKISWIQGTSTAAVLAVFAGYIGSTSAVLAALGSGLSLLAAATTGGTLTIEWQWYCLPSALPQYRYLWSFTANTGDYYGPFIHYFTYT